MSIREYACPRLNFNYAGRGVTQRVEVPYVYADNLEEIKILKVGCDEFDSEEKRCKLNSEECILNNLKLLK